MTSLREAVRRLLERSSEDSGEAPDPRAAYRFYWTKEVRQWPAERRRRLHSRVEDMVGAEDFEPTIYERRYLVEGLDDVKHAGVSLQALLTVLEGFHRFGREAEEEPS